MIECKVNTIICKILNQLMDILTYFHLAPHLVLLLLQYVLQYVLHLQFSFNFTLIRSIRQCPV